METGFLHETKTILKSLVISCPNGMTVDRLNRDYKDTVGGWIPFKKLGYHSLELFLKSVPDTLVLTGHGREARVGFVSNDKTQHINEMISRQKNTTRDRKSAVRSQPVQNYSRQAHAQPVQTYSRQIQLLQNPTNLFNHAISRIYCTYNPTTLPINNFVPVYQPVQNINQHHFQPQQKNFQPQQSRNFRAEKTYNQPSRSTASNPNSKKPEPPHQKTNTNNLFNETDENKKTQINNREKQNSTYNDVNKTSVFVASNNSRKILPEPNTKSVLVEIKNSNSNNIAASKDSLKNDTDDRKNANEKSNNEKSLKTADKITFPSKSSAIEKKASEVPKNSLKSQPVLNRKTEITTVTKNPIQQKTSQTQQTDSKKTTDSLMFPNAPIKFSSKKKLTEKIIKRPDLPTVSESKAMTIPQAKLVDIDAVSAVSKTSSFHDNFNTSKYLTDPFALMDSSDNDIDEAVPEFAADYRVFHVDFPENTVPFGKKIPSVQLPKEFTKGAVVGVFISEIHSPFKFWFHPHKENHELDVLMCGIESFYERLGDADLLIPKSCITPGQVCVALYNDMWHRAEILTTVTKNKVKAHFVDYGTVSDVEIHHVKYLQNRFAETPMQAIRGSLSHIKPVSLVWQKRAINEFLSLVAEVFLYAQIVEIDEKENTVYMVLCDTNSGQTLQINKVLVDRGFAKLDSEWDENKIKEKAVR
ncbi:tudor domain-containing protein 5 isoform X2 [Episyrphus balteatus]|uniref:tudor domain-containing protein 5 isoform X2 n=1 Tax=Episyrphus balteatus TaxID=286459 RepID=UPI0024858389|nr:tudor domain-containing protein 5 isoform X2 [Episyrphus balteatus]